ncbi:MAG TPA: EAL domain-containing protein [Devosiaceae bacterium]|nr:EAL domain-containing protein [Devosiaceae bacterium]
MTTLWRRLRHLRRSLMRSTRVSAVIALAVIIAAGLFADHQNNLVHRQGLEAKVLTQLSLIRAKLEGNINGNLQLVRGLVAAISTEPEMSQARFEELASRLLDTNSQIASLAVAPDLVVRMVYPLAGNERALGLDYRQNVLQRDAALRSLETGAMVLAGPVELVQGGTGFVGRFPVYLEQGSRRIPWGLVAVVVDAERLYRDSGLTDEDLPIAVAITGKDALGKDGTQFFGDAGILASDPVEADVIFPSGSWRLAAVPSGGWEGTAPNAGMLRAATVLFGLLVVLPIFVGTRLVEERQQHIRALGSREKELQILSRRLGLALETSQVGVFEYDLESGDLFWDSRMNEIYGMPADGGARDYTHWRARLHPDDTDRATEDFRHAVEVSGSYDSEYRIITEAGESRNIRALGTVYRDPGTSAKIVGVNWDVSADVALNESLLQANRQMDARNAELEAAKARIEHNALHDSLTGLPNRRFLDDFLNRCAARCAVDEQRLALLHVDLDRFKQINDTLGHAAGDAMLVHASGVLQATVREDDFVARIGGDEFLVVVRSSGGADAELATIAERVVGQMRQPVAYEGHECRFGVSVGIASASGGEIDAKRLLMNADIALYRAKSRGRNRYEFFSNALQAEVVRTKRVADEILQGLEVAQFLPHFQPQVDAATLEVVGVEALARWHHPTEGLLAPTRFLEVAEELSVVANIDRIILEQSLAQLDQWRKEGAVVPRISVNVSARRLQDENLVAHLKELDIEPGILAFELVETMFLDDMEETVRWNLDAIKEMGIDIEIDDFGTGYASVISLLQLKPSRLKIDRQLVMPITTSLSQRRLVASIIEIGKSLEIEVVGEGVETIEHAGVLRELGCDILQGYAFGRPMSGSDLSLYMTHGESARRRHKGAKAS